MVRFHLRNTVSRPFVLDFLKRNARIEKAGTRFSTVTFDLQDIDTTKRRTFETSIQQLRDNGCEVYIETDLKRLIPVTPAAPKEEQEVAVSEPKRTNRNLERVRAYASGDGPEDRTIFQGQPATRQVGVLADPSDPERTVSFTKEAPMSQMPGAKKGSIRVIPFDVEEARLAAQQRARGTAVPEPVASAPVEPTVVEPAVVPHALDTTDVVVNETKVDETQTDAAADVAPILAEIQNRRPRGRPRTKPAQGQDQVAPTVEV